MQLNTHYNKLFNECSVDFLGADPSHNPDHLVLYNNPLPEHLQHNIYVPITSPFVATYIPEQLLQAFYTPNDIDSIHGIFQHNYIINLSRPSDDTSSERRSSTLGSEYHNTIPPHSTRTTQEPRQQQAETRASDRISIDTISSISDIIA